MTLPIYTLRGGVNKSQSRSIPQGRFEKGFRIAVIQRQETGDARDVVSAMGAPVLIQRAVSYGGSKIDRNIDYFDPTTAPPGKPFGTAVRILVKNTQIAKSRRDWR